MELYKKYPQAGTGISSAKRSARSYAAGEHPSTAPKSTYGQYYASPTPDLGQGPSPAKK